MNQNWRKPLNYCPRDIERTVFPAKVTVVPVLSLLRFSVVEVGTARLESTIAVQDAVAEAT